MEALSLQELHALLDGRIVDLQNAVQALTDDLISSNYEQAIKLFDNVKLAEGQARKAYETLDDREMELTAKELEEN